MKTLVVGLGLIVSAVGVHFSAGRPNSEAKLEAVGVEALKSTEPSPCPCAAPQASQDSGVALEEDPKRCLCWYTGYDDQKAGKGIDDPNEESECNLKGLKQEYRDGWKSAKAGEGRKCPYKK